MIINISGDISLMDANDASSYVRDLAGEDANIIFGAKYDETMTDSAKITVIATGLETKKSSVPPLMSGMKYTPTAGASAGAAARPMNSGLTSRSGLGGAAGAGNMRGVGAGAGTSSKTSVNPTFAGIQKPKQPESSVPEKDIQIPTFLRNTRK